MGGSIRLEWVAALNRNTQAAPLMAFRAPSGDQSPDHTSAWPPYSNGLINVITGFLFFFDSIEFLA